MVDYKIKIGVGISVTLLLVVIVYLTTMLVSKSKDASSSAYEDADSDAYEDADDNDNDNDDTKGANDNEKTSNLEIVQTASSEASGIADWDKIQRSTYIAYSGDILSNNDDITNLMLEVGPNYIIGINRNFYSPSGGTNTFIMLGPEAVYKKEGLYALRSDNMQVNMIVSSFGDALNSTHELLKIEECTGTGKCNGGACNNGSAYWVEASDL